MKITTIRPWVAHENCPNRGTYIIYEDDDMIVFWKYRDQGGPRSIYYKNWRLEPIEPMDNIKEVYVRTPPQGTNSTIPLAIMAVVMSIASIVISTVSILLRLGVL